MRQQLIEITREIVAHGKTGHDPADRCDLQSAGVALHRRGALATRKSIECSNAFPLMLAMTAELPNVGDYKAMEAIGMPVLIVRGEDSKVRAFVNMCSHRGSQIAAVGRGTAKRFHLPVPRLGRTARTGALLGIFREKEFGHVDRACKRASPRSPRRSAPASSGVTLNSSSTLDIDAFLAGYGQVPRAFRLRQVALLQQSRRGGPELEDRVRRLHGLLSPADPSQELVRPPTCFSQAMYHAWGPHQRVSTPSAALADVPESEWSDAALMAGVWDDLPARVDRRLRRRWAAA